MIDWDIVLKIAVPMATLVLGIVFKEAIERRASIQYYVGTLADFMVRSRQADTASASVIQGIGTEATSPPVASDFGVYTHALVIVNGGRAPARNVRIGHVAFLQNYHVSPKLDYSIEPVKDSGDDIVFPILRPKEQVTVSYLYFEPVTPDQIHTYVKSDEGLAKNIAMLPVRRFPKWLNMLILAAMSTGIVAWIYLIVILVVCWL